MSEKVKFITDSEFEKRASEKKALLIEFYATWCGPCVTMAPILEEVADKVTGKAKIFKIDVDKNPKTASKYNVFSIPTLIIFKEGKPMKQMIGVTPANELIKAIESLK